MRKYLKNKDVQGIRPCNLCNKPFRMQSRFSRFCEPCKDTEEYRDGCLVVPNDCGFRVQPKKGAL